MTIWIAAGFNILELSVMIVSWLHNYMHEDINKNVHNKSMIVNVNEVLKLKTTPIIVEVVYREARMNKLPAASSRIIKCSSEEALTTYCRGNDCQMQDDCDT